jgi:prolyl 4-hydroxylase
MAKNDEKPAPAKPIVPAATGGGGPSSLTLLSALVALVALAVSGVAYSKPNEFQQFVDTARTRVLTALDQFQGIANAPPSLDCSAAEQFLTEVGPVKGFHVLCVKKTPQETYVRERSRLLGRHPTDFSHAAVD